MMNNPREPVNTFLNGTKISWSSFCYLVGMKKSLFLSVFAVLVFVFNSNAQNPVFDNLEMLYDQGHYRKVYRKANQLLDNPEYDYSQMPKYYRSISMMQLAQNDFWRQRNKGVIQEAEKLFYEVRETPTGQKIITAHMFELAKLRQDLTAWKFSLKEQGNEKTAKEVGHVISTIFDEMQQNLAGFQDVVEQEVKPSNESVSQSDVVTETQETEVEEEVNTSSDVSLNRSKIIDDAKKHLGTPYKWAGNQPGGFDCSGFTSYVLARSGQVLPRRSSDQYAKSKKLKRKNVQTGDLIFFSNGSGISHVGIITSKKGEPLQMIHSSSSRGIIITDVESSEYWQKRIHGYGTYID